MKRPGVRAVVARCISIRTEDLWEMLELRSLKVGKEGKGGVLEGGDQVGGAWGLTEKRPMSPGEASTG